MRLEPRGTISSWWGYRAIASAEVAPGRVVFVRVLPLAGPAEGGPPYPYELAMVDLNSMEYVAEDLTVPWSPPALDEEQATPTLVSLPGGRVAFFLPNSVTIIDTIVDGAPGWVVVSQQDLGGSQSHNTSVSVGDADRGLEEFTIVDVGTHLMVLGAGPEGAGYAEVTYSGTLLTPWTLTYGEWFRSNFPTNAVLSGGDVWWPQVIQGESETWMGVLRLHRVGGSWEMDWLTSPDVVMPGWTGVTQTIPHGSGGTVLVHAGGVSSQVFFRPPSPSGPPVYVGAFPGTGLSLMASMSPATGPPGIGDDLFFGNASAMESLHAPRADQFASWTGRIVVTSFSSGWVVAFHAEGLSVFRYATTSGTGLWLLRQRQTLPGAGSWPLRQRQHGGATGSWPLRQRQRGV